MEKRTLGETKNSSELSRRNSKFRDDKPMTVVAVPNVVVRELVHVDVQTVGVDVHVGNEEMYRKPPIAPSTKK